ncbi:terpenoid synthase [Biscogniauxia sp. FL1348]|nr:terpenoid synthase [Biscogniauxia sp. FL1348]
MAELACSPCVSVDRNLVTMSPGLSEVKPHEDSRARLVASMRGTKVVIPDFQQLLSHWPAGELQDADKLRETAHAWLEKTFGAPEDAKRLSWLKASGIDSLAACWWPYARFEALLLATYLLYWLFAWDDENDSGEFSSMLESFERACAFRAETLRYIEAVLSPSSTSTDADLAQISSHKLIAMFQPVGEAVKASHDEDQKQVFLSELRFFVQMVEEEHRFQTTGVLPTVDQYMRRRMGSSAVLVCLAVHEHALGIRLPREVLDSEPMKIIWHETNVIISIMNNIFSLKKEIEQDQVDSLIPLLTQQQQQQLGGSGAVQSAVDEATAMVTASVRRFEAAERDLLLLLPGGGQEEKEEEEARYDIRAFVDSCKYACTGNMNWR